MSRGLTYSHGATLASTIEANAPPRETGQWGAVHTSCAIRKASLHRVRLLHQSLITSTTGAVMVFMRPDRDYDDAGNEASEFLWHWRQDDNNRMTIVWDDGNGNYIGENIVSGSTDTVSIASTHSAGDDIAVYIAWDATNIYISLNGGTIQSASRSNGVPTITTTTVDIGSDFGVQFYHDGAYAGAMHFSTPLTQAQVTALAAFRDDRPPLLGEVVDNSMNLLWYGAHSLVSSLGVTAGAIDLDNGDDIELLEPGLAGAGVPVALNRNVELPLQSGASYIDTVMQTRVLTAPLRLSHPDAASAWTARRALFAALNPMRGEGMLHYCPDTTVYEIPAVLQAGADVLARPGPLLHRIAPVFSAFDPFWRIAARQETSITVALGGWTIPWTITWEITASSGTATGDAALNNTYDEEIRPTILITAGGSGCSGPAVRNDTTGELFDLSGLTLASNDTVTIDMNARTAIRGSDGVSVLGLRSADSVMWALAHGQNTITASVDDGSATVVIAYYPRLVGI